MIHPISQQKRFEGGRTTCIRGIECDMKGKGQRPGMLICILQCTGQPSRQRIIWPAVSAVPRSRNPGLQYVRHKGAGRQQGCDSQIEDLEYQVKILPRRNGCIIEFKAQRKYKFRKICITKVCLTYQHSEILETFRHPDANSHILYSIMVIMPQHLAEK